MLELTPKYRVGTITLRDPEGQSELKLQLLPFFVGDQGIQGIQGIKGDKGDKGDQGDRGATGDVGATWPFFR